MKLNLKTFKVLFAFLIIIGAIFWAVNTVRPQFYGGANLNFSVGTGTVRVTNPSEQAVSVQLLGSGSRSFRVSSTIEGVSGSSTRQGSGSSSSHLFEFELPSGTSEFTISRGTDVNFLANTTTVLQATVNPVNDETVNAILIGTIFVVLGSLFYASNATEHYWISWLRSQFASIEDISEDDTAVPVHAMADGGQGDSPRSFGDNRSLRPYERIHANTGD